MTDTVPSPDSERTELTMTGAELIATERERQVRDEGWNPSHDDEHVEGELAYAAECYIMAAIDPREWATPDEPPALWPEEWHPDWWKPSVDPVRNLVKGGALIAAEIDRLQRLTPKGPN